MISYTAEYEQAAEKTAPPMTTFEQRLALGALGLTGESGEVAEMVKKHLFHGHPLDHEKLERELGDVLWYLTLLARITGSNLHKVMNANIRKLEKRYPEGFFTSERSLNRAEGDT